MVTHLKTIFPKQIMQHFNGDTFPKRVHAHKNNLLQIHQGKTTALHPKSQRHIFLSFPH